MRILTYNVHSCIGADGRCSPRRIADVIAACAPDVVALQELDVGRARTGYADQAHQIALALGMTMHFHPALRVIEEQFGDAILTALPCQLIKAGPIPRLRGLWPETRGALWAAVEMDGVTVQVINTHLGLRPREQRVQIPALLGEEWMGHPDCRDPALLVGDFNAFPGTRAYRLLASQLTDAQLAPTTERPRATFPARRPLIRIDHVFTRGDVDIAAAEVVRTPLALEASDHLPLQVDLRFAASAGTAERDEERRTRPTDREQAHAWDR